jgi:hypothetical protein
MEPGFYRKVSALHGINPFSKQHSVEEELDRFPYNEDVFWAIEATKFDPSFQVAPARDALPFAFEASPRWSLEQTKGKLPFGCHAWARYDRDFWGELMSMSD